MLDAVFLAMFVICLLLTISIYLVRQNRQFATHRRLQIGLAIVLVIAILIFEIDVRFVTQWRQLARESRFYESGIVDRALWIHLTFAIPTPFVWAYVIVMALRKFPRPAQPNAHSAAHKFWGWTAAIMMWLTAATGCTFYWLAFAC